MTALRVPDGFGLGRVPPPNWTGVARGLIGWEPGMTSSREISSTRFF